MSVLHTIRARAETACSAFWPHHRELPPPWVHAVHVARSTENNSASCSCGSWRGGGCEPRATLIYWSMQLKHYVSCSVKTFHVFLFFACVCVCDHRDCVPEFVEFDRSSVVTASSNRGCIFWIYRAHKCT